MVEELDTINIGIFGHIDHGKTTLLQKLSGKWTDTHSEELKRGITIKLGYADIIIYNENGYFNIEKKGNPVRHVSFIDAPGHEMLMATTLSGAALIDAGLLVVAANEGLKPQTYEHLMALQAKKVNRLIVVQNKIDLVTKEQARKSYEEIKKFLGDKYSSAPIIPVSAQQNVNISKILEKIAEIPVPKRDLEEKPIFLIARSFDINKPGVMPKDIHGAVLGGSLIRGKLKAEDEIEIKPGRAEKTEIEKRFIPVRTHIVSLFKGSKKVDVLTPGGSMSIETELDMTLGQGDALAGNIAALPGTLPAASSEIKIRYSLFPKVLGISNEVSVESLKIKEVLMISINTSITGGSISSVNGDELRIALKVPAIVFKGDNVGIARNVLGHWRLIGYGEVL